MRDRRRASGLAAVAFFALASPCIALAESFYFAIDVPGEIAGASFDTNEIAFSSLAGYASELVLPDSVEISALHLDPSGIWAFTPRSPVELDGTLYEPNDIVATDGVTFASVWDGDAAGLSKGATIDALFSGLGGGLIISVDTPVVLDGLSYFPSDLIELGAPMSLYWSGNANGVPAYANVVGADETPDGLVLTFDVPTRLGNLDYLPGQLVLWNSESEFSSYRFEPRWPLSIQLRDFSLLPAAGAVPDGSDAAEVPLEVGRVGGNLELSWGASCSGDPDYAVYEGTLGDFTSHAPRVCSTGGATTALLTTPVGSTYYLVVPHGDLSEGSYGTDSNGERLPQPGACLPQSVGSCPAP